MSACRIPHPPHVWLRPVDNCQIALVATDLWIKVFEVRDDAMSHSRELLRSRTAANIKRIERLVAATQDNEERGRLMEHLVAEHEALDHLVTAKPADESRAGEAMVLPAN